MHSLILRGVSGPFSVGWGREQDGKGGDGSRAVNLPLPRKLRGGPDVPVHLDLLVSAEKVSQLVLVLLHKAVCLGPGLGSVGSRHGCCMCVVGGGGKGLVVISDDLDAKEAGEGRERRGERRGRRGAFIAATPGNRWDL